MGTIETQIENLRQAIAVLESQRGVLGDAVVGPALAGLNQQIAALQSQVPTEKRQADERRLLTILFTDVVGSTSLAEGLDPEEWRDIVNRLHSTVGEIVQANHGMVAQYLGDGLLAFFGAREISERDPENAIRCALQAQAAVAELAKMFPGLPSPLQVRMGIHTGLVVLGEIGSQARKELTATGDAVNLAARLQTSAPPEGVLISQDTYRCVRGVFDVSPQPMLAVKGKREPVQTFLVLRAKQRAFRTAARRLGGITAPIIGRDEELASLRGAYLAAYEQRALVWSQVIGEPGLGKSRLVDEMIDFLELRPEQLRQLRGRVYEGEKGQPFALIRRMWFDRFGIAEDAPLSEAEPRWLEGFLELGGKSPDVHEENARLVGLLVGLPFAGTPQAEVLRLDPAQLRGRAIVASRKLLRAIRRAGPVVILLEDLHWADPSSLEYLSQVVLEEHRADEQGLFVLATARPEWSPPEGLEGHPAYRQVTLHSLSGKASLDLVRELLRPVEGMPEPVFRMVVERAEGVPYFAEEIVHWLLDHGVIDRSQENWRFLPERLEQFQFPASLKHLLLARLNALEYRQRLALQRGAIYGRNFWTGGLAALGMVDSEQILRGLQPRGFIDPQPESSFEGESEWSFHHNLLREATYDSLLKRERATLHRAAAGWLEQQARQAGRLDDFAGLLGMHAELGGETGAAADWYLRAGERARGQLALREALGFFERALPLLPPEDRERRWQAMSRRCSLMNHLSQVEGRPEALQALLDLATSSGDPAWMAEANSYFGWFLANRGEDRQAIAFYDSGLAAARQAGSRSLEAPLLATKVTSLIQLGEIQAAGLTVEEALACAGQVTDEEAQAHIYTNVAGYYSITGDLALSFQMSEKAAQMSRLINRSLEAVNLSNMGYDYILLGMAEKSLPVLRQAIELQDSIGARGQAGFARLNLALAHFRLGELPTARQILSETGPEFEAVKEVFPQASTLTYLALALEAGGETDQAFKHYQRALEVLSSIEASGYARDVLAGLARCALAQGKLEAARQYAGLLWNTLQENGPQGMEFPIWGYLTCARVFRAAGDPSASRDALEAGYQELSSRAGKISNPAWRRSFLENIPEHREIVQLWTEDREEQDAG